MTWQKKYSWRVTWPGEGHEDYSAYDGDLYIGRIMLDTTTHGKAGSFMWSAGARGPAFKKSVVPQQGWAQEHWQAAKAVEDWYDETRRMNGMEVR